VLRAALASLAPVASIEAGTGIPDGAGVGAVGGAGHDEARRVHGVDGLEEQREAGSPEFAGGVPEVGEECRAQQRLADVATALGAPVARAQALADLSWRELYGTLPDDYRTPLCRDGGPYDLRPGVSGRWPWG